MRSWLATSLLIAVAAAIISIVAIAGPRPGPALGADDLVPGRYIVVLKHGVDPDDFADFHGRRLGFSRDVTYSAALQGFAANLNAGAVKDLKRNPNVAYIEQDRVARIATQALPTGILRIGADQNAAAAIDGVDNPLDVDIAIIDTGIDADHPDLNVVGGARFYGVFFACGNGSGSYDDDNGHGSHVAGIAAARDNDIGSVGVAPGARLWAVKVVGSDGSGYTSCIIKGVDWVTAHASTIEVANMSLLTGNSPALCDAIANSVAAGVTYAVAAGNSAADAAFSSPANCATALAVSAIADFDGAAGGAGAPTCRTDVDDTFADFSNYGSVVDIAAPGVCIFSTWKDGSYATISGTSMASPHVAGAAALFRASTGYSGPADGPSVLAAMTAAGWTAPQSSSCGFSGDPDSFPEPVLHIGGPCAGSPAPTPTPTDTPSPTPTPTPVAGTPTPTATPAPSSPTPTTTSSPIPTATSTPSPTATPTGTPTPAPPPGAQVPNGGFDTAASVVGTPPDNNGFETGTLSGWTATGVVTVLSGGPYGSYARLGNAATLTSSALMLPAQAQTLTYQLAFFTSNSCLTGYVLYGPTYASSLQLTPSDCGSSGWKTRTVNVTQWAGQSIKLKFQAAGAAGLDDAGIAQDVLDLWDVSGSPSWVPQLLSDGPQGAYGRVTNATAPVSGAFVVPTGGQVTLTYMRRVATGGSNTVWVRCGASFAQCTRLITNDSEAPGVWITRQFDLTAYAGQTIKIEFFNAGAFDWDAVTIAVK